MNQYSFIILGLVILIAIGALSWRFMGIKYTLISIVLGMSLLAVFQTISSTDTASDPNFEVFSEARASGKPLILQLYSNY